MFSATETKGLGGFGMGITGLVATIKARFHSDDAVEPPQTPVAETLAPHARSNRLNSTETVEVDEMRSIRSALYSKD